MTDEMPSNELAEKAVLGAIINDPIIFDKIIAWIRQPEAFWYNRNQRTWKTLLELYKAGVPIDPVTVTNRFKEKYKEDLEPTFVAEIRDIGIRNENSEHHARIVWERHVQREAIKVVRKLESIAKTGSSKDVQNLLDQQSKYIEELKNMHPSKERSMDIIVSNAAESLIKGHHIIEWGQKELDDYAGGMTRGEFTALGGRPGNGKTTLMLNMIDYLTMSDPNLKIMVFNREMTNQAAIGKMMVMNSTSIKTDDLRKRELESHVIEEVERQRHILTSKYPNLRMYDDIIELDESIREVRRYEPDVVFDDYIQLIKINGKRSRDRRFEIEDIVNEYKWALKKVNASGILISQLSRDIEKRIDNTPTMADYSEGGTIEQGAETCMFVYYPYYFDPAEWSPHQNEIIVKKARYGSIGTYTVGFSGPKCKFFISPTEAKEIST